MSEDVQSHLKNCGQILKARDDRFPIFLKPNSDDRTKKFKLCCDTACSWTNVDSRLGPEQLRSRIEPWLTALAQSEHRSLLLGSGLERVHLRLTHSRHDERIACTRRGANVSRRVPTLRHDAATVCSSAFRNGVLIQRRPFLRGSVPGCTAAGRAVSGPAEPPERTDCRQ